MRLDSSSLSLSSQEKEDFSIASVPMKCNDEKNDDASLWLIDGRFIVSLF